MQKSFALFVFTFSPGLVHAQSGEAIRFEKDVLPIFTQYCFTCHAKTSPQLGLDLRTAVSTLKGSYNGPVVVKGSPEKSLLFEKISKQEMPPPAFKQKLPDTHIETIRKWIAGGALSDQSAAVDKDVVEQRARFDKEVLPLFRQRCVQCHGAGKPMGGLDLRSFSGMIAGSANGPVVAEGFSEKSVLLRKLSSRAMPPPGAGQPLAEAQIATIRSWVDKGHFLDPAEPEPQREREFTKAEAPDITEKDRAFWSFRKPVAVTPPKVRTTSRVRTPLDSFLLSRLEAKGLSFSPDAPAITLARRAYLDLIGLPPSPEELRAFTDDTKPGAYERLIDRLLASPQYGERWGRYWLDAAGYVDTNDKDFDPAHVELAEGIWRYRDYVIQSLNRDKPWDRFLTEQIAGDELVDWRNATKYTPETLELLTATGYMRTVLDITDADITNLPVERYETLFKLVEKVSSSTMGMTVGCARCHSHKFDPIPQRDYYRTLALFTSAYNPTNWLQPKNRRLYTISKPEQEEAARHNKEVDQALEDLEKQLARVQKPYEDRVFEEKLKTLPEAIREDARTALATPEEKRDEVQKFLAAKFKKALTVDPAEWHKLLNETDRATVERLEPQIATWTGYRYRLEPVQALWDVGKPPTNRLLQRGSAENPGPRVDPGFLTVLCSSNCTAARPTRAKGGTSGLRLAFADWLTSRDNPLTARVIVNRIWLHHFGKGIVETPDNFGRTGSPPSNQELLDWLAVDFMEHGWTAKRIHRLIMLSTAYRQTSKVSNSEWIAKAKAEDPENRLLWRMNLRRMEAEIVRDSVLATAGKLDRTMFGPPVAVQFRADGLQIVSSKESAANQNRRSVYLMARRTYPLTFLRLFDFPVIDTNCTYRTPSATPLQSLALLNDPFMSDSAATLAQRVEKMAGNGASVASQIEALYLITLGRKPAAEEIALCEEYLRKQQQRFVLSNQTSIDAAHEALASLSQSLLSSNEFLYIE